MIQPRSIATLSLFTAVLSSVSLQAQPRQAVRSKISIYDLKTKSVQVVFTADKLFEAPNWWPDGHSLLVNSEGALWRLPMTEAGGVKPERIELASVSRVNNDHGVTRDGKRLAISANTSGASQVYLASADGSNVRLIDAEIPQLLSCLFAGWPAPKIRTVVKLFGGQGTINVNSWAPDSRKFAFVGYEIVADR
jgi:TolB protein